jgi:hypothetical protein
LVNSAYVISKHSFNPLPNPRLATALGERETMSDDSAPNEVTDSKASPAETTTPAAPSRGKLRQVILFSLLAVMLAAFAYDYRVARPRVEEAYKQIVELNDATNSMAMANPTLNTDIHREISRTPSRTYTDGPYRVEVFSWMAGLPFRSHNLYAIYTSNGNDLVFMRHYKFVMPENELNPPSPQPTNGESGDDELDGEEPGGGGMGGMPPFRDGPGLSGGGGRPQRPSGESDDEGDNPHGEEGAVSPDDSPEEETTSPEATTPEATTPEATGEPTEEPADATPPAEPATSEAKEKDA